MKKRILFVNEFSQLATGFSTYGNEVMRRLNATGKYELAELASYCSPEDQRVFDVPWQVYPTMPRANDKAGWDQYHAIKTAQFGSTALSSCLLDFKPDITIEIRDPWMSEHNLTNPFRPFHKFIWMATIDGEPQKPEWLDSYRRTDYLLTYSEWAANLVKSKGVKVAGTHQPGTDTDVYCPPENKRRAKEDMGINPDWFIIQTVMRNQPRKLYPELFKAFSRYIELCKESGKDELAAKSYLHIHCALRDVGWDLAQEVKNYHLAHKVLFTYIDRSNGQCYLSFYKGEPAWSRDNNQKSSGTVSTGYGVSREQLAKIMQIADLYIQYSISEGAGMPDTDAKSCGVPIMGLPYSATAEKVIEPGGIPLKIAGWRQESIQETSQRRCEPDNEYTAREFYKFFTATQSYRDNLSKEARDIAVKKYTWDNCAKKWETLLDSIAVPDHSETWNSPPQIHRPELQSVPNNLPPESFIGWCYQYIVGRPWLLTYSAFNTTLERMTTGNLTKDNLIKECTELCENYNRAEIGRHNMMNNIKPQARIINT